MSRKRRRSRSRKRDSPDPRLDHLTLVMETLLGTLWRVISDLFRIGFTLICKLLGRKPNDLV